MRKYNIYQNLFFYKDQSILPIPKIKRQMIETNGENINTNREKSQENIEQLRTHYIAYNSGNSERRLNYIKKHNSGMFQYLVDAKTKGAIVDIPFFMKQLRQNNNMVKSKKEWEKLGHRKNVCSKQLLSYYLCKTCNQDPSYKVCQMCFDHQYHRGHNYVVINQAGYCLCGIPTFVNNRCSIKHQYVSKYSKTITFQFQPQHRQLQAHLCLYVVCLAQFMTTYFNIYRTKSTLNENIIKELFSLLLQFNQDSLLFNQCTSYCLSLPFQGTHSHNFNILQTFFDINRVKCIMPEKSQRLFMCLLNCHQFTYILIQSIHIYSANLAKIRPLLQNLLASPIILSQCAENDVNLLSQSKFQLNEFYRQMFIKMSAQSYHNAKQCIVPIIKSLAKYYKQQYLFINQLFPETHQFMLYQISCDYKLLQNLLRTQIKNKSYHQGNGKNEDRQWYNIKIRAILYASKGSINQFLLFFKQFDPESITKFVSNYFSQLVQHRHKSKFNKLTVICLYKLAKCYNVDLSVLVYQKQASTIKCIKFFKNLFVLVRNILTGDHLICDHLYKIERYHGELSGNSKAHIYKRIIMQWLNNYLLNKKQMSCSEMLQLRKSKTLYFSEAITFIQQNTKYNQTRRVFQFQVADDLQGDELDRIIKKKQIKYQQCYQTNFEKDIYCSRQVYKHSINFQYSQLCQFIQEYIVRNMQHVQMHKFISFDNQNKHNILFVCVLLDKIMQGDNIFIRQTISHIKSMLAKTRHKCYQLQKLFNKSTQQPTLQKQQANSTQNLAQQIKQNSQSIITSQNCLPDLSLTGQQRQIETTSLTELVEKQQEAKQKQKQRQRQISEAQLQLNIKREKKINRIKQKYKRKSTKYSQDVLTHPQPQQQICLICRQASAKHKQKSFLFYLGSLKSDELTQIIYGLKGQQFTITCCFHPYHLKCLYNNMNNFNICILCKSNSNFIMPVINNSTQSQYFTKIWWDDFLSLPDFTPVKNKQSYYGYSYLSNPQQNKKQSATQKVQISESVGKTQRYKNFFIVYRCLVMRITSFVSKSQWSVSYKKNLYFYQLLHSFYDNLGSEQRKKIKEQTEQYEKVMRNSILSQFLIQLIIIASKSLSVKLEGLTANTDIIETLKSKCIALFKKYPETLLQKFIKNIQWLLQCHIRKPENDGRHQQDTKLNEKTKQPQAKRDIINKQLLKSIFSLSIPDNMQVLYESRTKCLKCNSLKNWLCLFCKNKYCRNCDPINLHYRQKHHNNTILALFFEQGVVASVSSYIQQYKIYTNFLQQQFNSEVVDELKSYRCSYSKLNRVVEGLFKKYL